MHTYIQTYVYIHTYIYTTCLRSAAFSAASSRAAVCPALSQAPAGASDAAARAAFSMPNESNAYGVCGAAGDSQEGVTTQLMAAAGLIESLESLSEGLPRNLLHLLDLYRCMHSDTLMLIYIYI
jgi:hypothetical protein